MKVLKFLSLAIISTLLISCNNDIRNDVDSGPITGVYLHISHTRTNSDQIMDSIVSSVDYSKYDMLWLGGDLADLTSEDDQTISYVDSIFNLGSDNTLWALGNHDYTDLNRVQEFSKRPPFYAYYKNEITFIIIDTQDSLSSILTEQMELLSSVLETVQRASHLVVLHHKLMWMNDNDYLQSQIEFVSNGIFGDCFHCINPNNFYSAVYPMLIEVKERGIEVLCIGGDIGNKINEFEYITNEGIHFLASGNSFNNTENKALLFSHDIINKQLNWEYKLISDL